MSGPQVSLSGLMCFNYAFLGIVIKFWTTAERAAEVLSEFCANPLHVVTTQFNITIAIPESKARP